MHILAESAMLNSHKTSKHSIIKWKEECDRFIEYPWSYKVRATCPVFAVEIIQNALSFLEPGQVPIWSQKK